MLVRCLSGYQLEQILKSSSKKQVNIAALFVINSTNLLKFGKTQCEKIGRMDLRKIYV